MVTAKELLFIGEVWLHLDREEQSFGWAPDATVQVVFRAWVRWLRSRTNPSLLDCQVRHLRSFARLFGELPISDVRLHHLEWFTRTMQAGPRTRHVALNAVLLALTWSTGGHRR